MLFNSLEFAIFLAFVLTGYFLMIPASFVRTRKGFLVVASYVFYMSWSPPFGLLLLFSTVLDFTIGLQLEKATAESRRRMLIRLSLLGNLGVLGFFKYGNFLIESFYGLLRPWFEGAPTPHMDIVLPIGISFYTFQTLSYSIDVYRRRIPPTRNLLDFRCTSSRR